MNAKHTPGPWQFGKVSQLPAFSLPKEYQRIYMPDNDAAFVSGSHAEANARLIAASPDLKAALENALRSMEYAAMALEAPEKCALRENIEQAKEALKKSGLE
jgi:phytoene dehydrogenase-like protein